MGCSSSSPVGPAPPIGTLRSLQAATRGGPAALRKHFADVPFPAQPGLDAWAAALADAQAEGWARAVVAAVDALWTPLVAAVEKKLSDPEVSAAYDALTPRLLRLLLHQAAHGADAPPPDDADADAPLESPIAAGAPLWAGRAASEGLLRLGAALWAAHSAGSPAAAAEGAFASEALRRLLALLSIALCRTVGVEAPATFGAKLREWDATRAHFGLPRPALCALLDGPSKALLLYADGCAARGDGRVRVDVTRGAALWDALPQWEGTAFAHADADAVSMAIGGGGGGGGQGDVPCDRRAALPAAHGRVGVVAQEDLLLAGVGEEDDAVDVPEQREQRARHRPVAQADAERAGVDERVRGRLQLGDRVEHRHDIPVGAEHVP